jgi:hypothetical protein
MTALLLALLVAATPADADGGSADVPQASSTITEEPGPSAAPQPKFAVLPPMQQPSAAALPAKKPADDEGDAQFRASFATGALTMPSGTPGGEQDFFAYAEPEVLFQANDDFVLAAGANLRFRVIDLTPKQTATDYGANLRREDWDELSDFGQILHELRMGSSGSAFQLKAGQVENFTLGLGHLVSRYDNRTDENYHPAGATLQIDTGPVRVQGLVSDLLAGRLFAGDVRLDLGRVFGDESDGGRWHLSVSMLQDFAKGDTTRQITAMEIDPDVVVFDQQGQKVDLYLGIGTRIGQENNPPLGALIGLRTDGRVHHTEFHGSFEIRKQSGRYRQGLIGPTYELARFADVGTSGPSVADAQLPDGWSFYAEGQLDVPDDEGNVWLTGSASAEHFTFDRTDLDGLLRFKLPGGEKVTGAFRFDATGLGQSSRVYLQAELRVRLSPSIFGQAFTGTSFFPQPDNTLVHGFFGGLGIGADFDSNRIEPTAQPQPHS